MQQEAVPKLSNLMEVGSENEGKIWADKHELNIKTNQNQ